MLAVFTGGGAFAQVSATRTIAPASIPEGGSASVSIAVEVNEANKPAAVIVVEFIPPGLQVVESTAKNGVLSKDGSELRWLLGGFSELTSTTLEYALTFEDGNGPGATASVSGVLRYIDGDEEMEDPILGDTTLSIREADDPDDPDPDPDDPDPNDPGESFHPADITRSGRVDAVDVQLVINAALGEDVGLLTDINGDGVTNAVDVQLVINAALGIIALR